MLSMSAMSGGQAGYYLGLAREDYYLEGGEPPGIWFGAGSESLGLSGHVHPDHLYNLFDGLAPDGSYSLVRQGAQSHGNHRPGWDLTFSAPKSVSALWSQASEENRQQIQEAQKGAVDAALGYLQESALFTRRGRQGEELEKVGMVAALFEHSTSRALDPQLHTHALVLNVATRGDLTTGTVSSFHLFLSKMVAGALYRVELAHQLEQRLGLVTERRGTWFEVAGVDQKLIDHFSTRRQAIVKELQKKGLTSAEAAVVAAIETRQTKAEISRPQLFQEWRQAGKALGWTTEQAEGLLFAEASRQDVDSARDEALTLTTERMTHDQAHFTFRDFARALAEESQGRGVSAATVLQSAGDHLATSEDIVRLGFIDGEQRYTTATMLDLETGLLQDCNDLQANIHHQVSSENVIRVLSKHEELSEEQLKAVWHLSHDSGGIGIVSGMAGTGKTRMLTAAKEAWESEGFRVIGAAISARAASQLQEDASIPSQTIAKIIYDLQKPVDKSPAFEELTRAYGPDVLEPIKKLGETFGPDIADPLRKLMDKYGPNILEPFQKLAKDYGPNILEPLEAVVGRYGPDIGEAWRTFARYLKSNIENRQQTTDLDRNTILVVDEAAMVATPQMAQLAEACKEAGAKLVLVGDERQLQPIGPGAPFSTLGKAHGRAELTEIRRQNDAWERRAVKDIAAGRAAEALREYASRGLITIRENVPESMLSLVEDWHADGLPLARTLILAGTRKEVRDINALCQERRLSAGELGPEMLTHQGEEFHQGDQVIFTKNSKPRGVHNGVRGQIVDINEQNRGITVKLESGNRTTIQLDDFGHVSLGYATTTHKAQGATVDRAYVLAGGRMQDRELSYVQASRARESTRFYATPDVAGDALAGLAARMERSRQKQMAHEMRLQP